MAPINKITREDVKGFRDMYCHPGSALDQYQKVATRSAFYPGQGTPLGLAYVALKLNGEAGEFSEHVGKAMRDDNFIPTKTHDDGWRYISLYGELTPSRKLALIKEIGDQLWYLSAACNELGITLSEAALANLEKLCDRGERGALQGSGDDR